MNGDLAVVGLGTDNVFDVKIREVEGQFTTVGIVRDQTGLSALLSGYGNISVMWTPPGSTVERAMAVGRMSEMPGDLFSATQTMVLTCAPEDINDQLLAFAKTVGVQPWYDRLMSDFDPEDPNSYLSARSATFHVHPVTHEISLNDDIEGERILDMRNVALFENGRAKSTGFGDAGALTRQLKAELTVEWTQAASGTCNVGAAIGDIHTLDPNFASNIQSTLTTELAEGWSSGSGSFDYSVKEGIRQFGDLGTLYESELEIQRLTRDGRETVVRKGTHRLEGDFAEFTVSVKQLRLAFNYRQSRREKLTAVLSVPLVYTGVEKPSGDVIGMSISDPLDDPEMPAYKPGPYEKGDHVWYNGRLYRTDEAHYSTDFRMQNPRPIVNVISGPGSSAAQNLYGGYWKAVVLNEDDRQRVFGPHSTTFFGSERGERLIQHVMLRLRKEARRRCRALRVQLVFAWADAADLSVKDSIRFEVFEGAGGWRTLIGKVYSIERHWPSDGSPKVTVDVVVSFGLGGPGELYDDYFESDFAMAGYHEASGSLGDVEYTFNYNAGRETVATTQLRNPAYSVLSVRKGNETGAQLAAAAALRNSNQDVRSCTSQRPTWATIKMRPLPSGDVIEGEASAFGELKTVFGGV